MDINFDSNGLFIAEHDGTVLGFVNCVFRKIPISAYSGMQWTPTSGAADAIYKKAGFEITKTYATFSKTI